ncbi:MAG: site-2 protease family protein [Bacteroidota bacterium]
MSKPSKYTKYLEWIIMGALFFGLIFLSNQIGLLDDLKLSDDSNMFLVIIGGLLMLHLVLGVHELGHLLVGLVQGFRFELYVVGFLGIKREEEKVKVYFNKNLGYYGGVAATSPTDGSPDNAKKFARILLAGPIASILFAVICYVIALYSFGEWKFIFYLGALASIGIFIATTVPSRTGMFFTDRKRFQRLIKPGKDREIELAMLNIMGQFTKDNSYENIKKSDIELMTKDDTPFIRYFGLFNLICYQIERGEEADEETMAAFHATAEKMPKNLVTAFNNEIEKYRSKYIAE